MNAPTIHRPRSTAVATAAAALLLLTAAACGSDSTSASTTGGGGGGAVTVTAKDIAFNPTTVSVPAGVQVTITFDNQDSVLHSLTFDDNSQSVEASAGQSQTLVFTAPAAGTTITFHCKYHASMHGKITVGGAGAAGSASGASSSSSGGYYGG